MKSNLLLGSVNSISKFSSDFLFLTIKLIWVIPPPSYWKIHILRVKSISYETVYGKLTDSSLSGCFKISNNDLSFDPTASDVWNTVMVTTWALFENATTAKIAERNNFFMAYFKSTE